jgi:hypothetical protein
LWWLIEIDSASTQQAPLHQLRPMKLRAILLCLLGLLGTGGADTFPEWPVHFMSGRAEAIIVGEQTEGDLVQVKQWLLKPAAGAPDGIRVDKLAKHSKLINAFWSRIGGKEPKELRSKRFVAFLRHEEGRWYVEETLEDSGICGSCGLIWIEDGKCYRYHQVMNPGPYDLLDPAPGDTEAGLLKEIATGLADAAAWKEALAVEDPVRRAEGIVRYAMESSSPEKPNQSYRGSVREVLRTTGAAALPAIREQIAKWQPGDSVDELVLCLYDMGQVAHSEAPVLLALLKQPERAHGYYVISALGTVGDASVIPILEPYAKGGDENFRRAASEAIERLSK